MFRTEPLRFPSHPRYHICGASQNLALTPDLILVRDTTPHGSFYLCCILFVAVSHPPIPLIQLGKQKTAFRSCSCLWLFYTRKNRH